MTEQERFEVAYENTYKPIIARPYPKLENGSYQYLEIGQAWELWKAASAQAVPDGFVVVPEDATEVMIQQGDNEVDHNGHGTSVAAVWDAMIQAAQEI